MPIDLSHPAEIEDLVARTSVFIRETVLPLDDQFGGDIHAAGGDAACEVLSTADTRAGVYGSPIKSLVVVGDQDTQPFQLAADWFMGTLPRAAILRLSGAHAAPIESRKDFVSALGGFVLEIERENSQTSEYDGRADSSPGALGGKGPT